MALNNKGVITCPLHHAQFDCATGRIVSDPPISKDQIQFQIEVKDGKIYWLKED